VTATGGSPRSDSERAALVTVRCTLEPHDAATLRIRVTAWPRLDVEADTETGAEFEASVHATVEGALQAIADHLRTFAAGSSGPASAPAGPRGRD